MRVVVRKAGEPKSVVVVQVPSSIEQLLEVANIRLCIHSTSITNELGGRIEDLEVIRDGDVLYFDAEELPIGIESQLASSSAKRDEASFSGKSLI
ncbi:BTB/POZ domain-containing protein KCTD9-like [Corticium candelabrum]|uniref:BTB/POZ domain-containing protein KCTD9-like n=1 Tax=Corticium candelabrum TaxID=121492 RepID=UPI002E27101A|nr:BTB/POZ domain-containing protein KCTD9-like [Corticium candelabrum]